MPGASFGAPLGASLGASFGAPFGASLGAPFGTIPPYPVMSYARIVGGLLYIVQRLLRCLRLLFPFAPVMK